MKFTGQTKLAIFVAPFLLIGGYIASDAYIESQAMKERVFQLVPQGHCDVVNQRCVLSAGEFKLNISDTAGVTQVNATFPLDSASFFIVHSDSNVVEYKLVMADNPYYWQRETQLSSLVKENGDSQRLRVIATIKGGRYISEFYTQKVQ